MGWQIGIERWVSTARCSHCGATGLHVALRCQLTHNACLGTVRCEACGAIFEVSTGAHPDGPQPDLHAWLRGLLATPADTQGENVVRRR
ncbi:MAG: hypothetical protein HYV62_07755 [Candidatus Rokubacteria bacterium]|nr:hypothetical protein [Candidatus Rokubacteria bacterium]